jgi:FkbH-like protein
VNAGIETLLAQHRTASGRALALIDETRLLAQDTDEELGRTLSWSPLHRPAVLGYRLATTYRDRIYVASHLLGRKVVVSDLDDTLWHGVTGEGAIRHDVGRQTTLRRLRDRGVLLAVNSKNDPAGVRWEGGVLDPEDFAHAEINWDPKAENMRRIQTALNLRLDDFVFIDDEADQREMIRLAAPEIHALDPGDPRCWRLLGAWADLLLANPDVDRTALYRQREQRQRFVDAEVSVQDPRELFSRLDIHVHIREADRDDLPRAAELINRTNQFNTCGSRTTVPELADWRTGINRHVLLVDASDKFGSNGTVAVMLLETPPDAIRIPCFVLSCRVFGFGIEHAVVNHVKRAYRRHDRQPIVGHITATPHNRPCREVYRHNGFTWDGAQWVYRQGDDPVDPRWLTVHTPRETRRLHAVS